MKDLPIGIFDSGIGGLTVQREITRALPAEKTLYLGDTAHVPYGTKSREAVRRFSLEVADFLVKRRIKLLVVACNTASAYALVELRSKLNVPVIGVIEPGAGAAVKATRTGRVGVIGTDATVRSRAYLDAIKGMNPEVEVFSKACPLFVPLAEEGFTANNIAELTARHYLEDFITEPVDTLVLGCTHYPLLKGVISQVMGKGVTLIDSAEATASEVRSVLKEGGLLGNSQEGASHAFYVTDSPERFVGVGKVFLGEKLSRAELVKIR